MLKPKHKLPSYINFTSLLLGPLCAAYMQQEYGWTVSGNAKVKQIRENKGYQNADVWCFGVGEDYMNWYSTSTDETSPTAHTFEQFLNIMEEPVISVGNHTVEFSTNGIKVGCQEVSWETIEQILACRPSVAASTPTP